MLLLYLFVACTNEENAEAALQDEVITIHDEVMPKMDELMKVKADLQKKVDSLRLEEADTALIITLKTKINQLRKADSAMMTWMRQFKSVRDTVSHDQRMRYLEQEKERIEQVRSMMNKAIEDAQNSGR